MISTLKWIILIVKIVVKLDCDNVVVRNNFRFDTLKAQIPFLLKQKRKFWLFIKFLLQCSSAVRRNYRESNFLPITFILHLQGGHKTFDLECDILLNTRYKTYNLDYQILIGKYRMLNIECIIVCSSEAKMFWLLSIR